MPRKKQSVSQKVTKVEIAEVQSPLALLQNISIDVNKDDVIAIRLSQIEEFLTAKRQEIDAAIDVQEKKVEGLKKDLAKSIDDLGQELLGEKSKMAEKAMQALFPKVKLLIRTQKDCKDKYIVVVNVCTGEYSGGITMSETLTLTAAQKKMESDIEDCGKEIDRLARECAEVRRQLGSLATVERKVRAELAKSSLSQTSEGLELLRRISGINIAGMPQLTAK